MLLLFLWNSCVVFVRFHAAHISPGRTKMAKEAFVDEDMCIGCGICITNLPDVFRFNSNGKAECFDPAGASEEEIQTEAIDACPVSCICWR